MINEQKEYYPDYRPAHLMLKEDDPLRVYGYCVYTHPSPEDYFQIKEDFRQHLISEIALYCKNKNISLPKNSDEKFKLEDYHLFIEEYGIEHHDFIQSITRYLAEFWCEKPYLKKILTQVKDRFGRNVGIFKKQVQFRVVRPKSLDNNPPHRDHWYPYFKPLINIYVPLAGSYVDSSLPVVPFSHFASDEDVIPTFGYNEGHKTVKSNGISYSVPEIKESKIPLNFHRPDVPDSNYMLFSPWTVHGGGSNDSKSSRFSFEIRLEFEGWE